MADRTDSRVSSQKVYGKMRWLEEMGDFKMSDKEDLADMAFGSEFFKIRKIELTLSSLVQGGDRIETLDQLKHHIEQLAKRHDVDPNIRDKLQAFAEDPGCIGKTKKIY